MRPLVSLPILLTAGCAIIAFGLLWSDVASPVAKVIVPISSDGLIQPSIGHNPSLSLPNPVIYTIIAARPLFFSNRRPPQTPVNTSAAPNIPSLHFSLIGVIDAPGQNLALVDQSGQQAASLVHVGSMVDGWRVTKINENSIDVRYGSTSSSLEIVR